eukprot:scaffold6783_cov18-Tisochrysis_lutea.AAC.1
MLWGPCAAWLPWLVATRCGVMHFSSSVQRKSEASPAVHLFVLARTFVAREHGHPLQLHFRVCRES